MSDATYKAVEDAVAAHLADEQDGALLVDWVLSAAGVAVADDARTSRYVHANSDSAWHPLMGLMHQARISFEQRFIAGDDDV